METDAPAILTVDDNEDKGPARLLLLSLVQSQRHVECGLATRRHALALSVPEDGLHSLRADWRRRAAGLVTAH